MKQAHFFSEFSENVFGLFGVAIWVDKAQALFILHNIDIIDKVERKRPALSQLLII